MGHTIVILQRIQFGGCSFIPPEGFRLQKEASLAGSSFFTGGYPTRNTGPSVSITLIRKTVYPAVPDYSESPEDIFPDAYPPTLSLVTLPKQGGVSPVDYLRNAGETLTCRFENFRMEYCRKDAISGFSAACSQCCFVSNFEIFLLNFAWVVDETLVASTMMATKSRVEKGWTDLRRFVASVEF